MVQGHPKALELLLTLVDQLNRELLEDLEDHFFQENLDFLSHQLDQLRLASLEGHLFLAFLVCPLIQAPQLDQLFLDLLFLLVLLWALLDPVILDFHLTLLVQQDQVQILLALEPQADLVVLQHLLFLVVQEVRQYRVDPGLLLVLGDHPSRSFLTVQCLLARLMLPFLLVFLRDQEDRFDLGLPSAPLFLEVL